jgi:RNA polymerase sigma-70 factor (ECF subfamily)
MATADAALSSEKFAEIVEPHRTELRAHCYRMAGSLQDADDLLQEALLRAWRGFSGFDGRASLRTWLYKITTHVCLDELAKRKREPRSLPEFLGPPGLGEFDEMVDDPIWLDPCPDGFSQSPQTPEARYGSKESVAFAFLVALQMLPAQQRAVLISRDVLGFSAQQSAEFLELSVAATNSALQRARETLDARKAAWTARSKIEETATTKALLQRYLEAWEAYDAVAFLTLLKEDVTLAMPPFREWRKGARAVYDLIAENAFRRYPRGAMRLVPARANGLPAFAAYIRDDQGVFQGRAMHVLDLDDDGIAAMHVFLDAAVIPRLGLPTSLLRASPQL